MTVEQNNQPSAGQEFRLSELRRIKAFLNKEIEHQHKCYKRYKRWANIFYYIETGLTPALSCGAVSLFANSISISLKDKAQKHETIWVLASTTLQSMNNILIKALEHSYIIEAEYEFIVKEHKKYLNMKKGQN